MANFYTLTTDPSSGKVIVASTYAAQPSALGENETAATQAQVAAFQATINTPTPYAELIAGGMTLTSTGTPALNGVYAIDPVSQADISTEAQFISTFAEFTNGGTTNLIWTLQSGAIVTFPTTAAFLSFAKAAAQLVAAAKLAQAQGLAMPAASVTIP